MSIKKPKQSNQDPSEENSQDDWESLDDDFFARLKEELDDQPVPISLKDHAVMRIYGEAIPHINYQ